MKVAVRLVAGALLAGIVAVGLPNGAVAAGGGSLRAKPTLLTARASDDLVLTRAQAAAAVSSTAVAYYATRYGVSPAEARSRLETQDMVPNLQALLQERLGSGLAQLWFDNSTGQWVVDVDSAAAAPAALTIAQSVGLGEDVRVENVAFTAKEMRTEVAELYGDLRETIASGQFTVGSAVKKVEVMLASGQSTKPVDAAVTKLKHEGKKKVPVSIVRSPESSLAVPVDACTQFPWCSEIVGGAGIFFATGWMCSAGFYVRSSGDPYPLILTAGHCAILAGNYGAWGTCNGTGGCGWYGHQIPFYYFGWGGGDAGLLEDDSYGIYPGYVNWTDGHSISTLLAYETGAVPDRVTVCLNGEHAPGTSCGEVYNNNDWGVVLTAEEPLPPWNIVNQMVEVSGSCSEPGDSGGPVTRALYEEAVGTISAGGRCGTYDYVEPIWREVEQLGISIETG